MSASYFARRVALFIAVIWAAATVNFFLPRMSGQDPIRERLLKQVAQGTAINAGIENMVREYDAEFGLDRPLWQQYVAYLADTVQLNLNYSITNYPKPVRELIGQALPWTIGLLTVSTFMAFALGTVFGALIAWPHSPAWLRYLAPPIITLSAIPYYLLGLILLFIFAFGLKVLPAHGGYAIGSMPQLSWGFAGDVLQHAILPAWSIVLSSVGFWALGMRAMMVTVEGEDFMTFAEAKGLKDSTLFYRYAIRSALLPQVTSLALSLGYVMSGSILVEVVFGFPGIGSVLFNAITGADYPLIEGVVFTIILSLSLATFVLDLILPLLDPRISYRKA